MTPQLFVLVTNPCEGTFSGWKAQSTDSQHRYMIDLFLLDSRLAGATDGGVGGAFQPRTNRQCQLHQSSRFLIERSRFMTAISQIVKSLPHGWIELPDFFNWFRQLSRHSAHSLVTESPLVTYLLFRAPCHSPILVYSRLCQSLYGSVEPGLNPNSGPSSTSVSLNWAHTSTQANSTLPCGPLASL